MAHKATGLDIGTFAVRAVEVSVEGDRVALLNFGQVALPPGAVVAGEVMEPQTVGAALRRLWRQAGFASRKVVVGVANTRLIVRQAELPMMPESDIRAALPYEAAELIPIPLEDAELDFQVVGEMVTDESSRARLLLAAAQRGMLEGHLAAVRAAGLRAQAIDPSPLAMVRALTAEPIDVLGEDSGTTEAIVSLGAGVVTVVVHEDGVPRFVRIFPGGGDELTDALSYDLGIEFDEAEDQKRRLGQLGGGDPGRAGQVLESKVASLADDVRGSLDFYATQQGARPIERVLLTGGASRTSGIFEALSDLVRIPVEPGRVLHRIEAGGARLSPEELAASEPLLAVPLGLGLGGIPLPGVRRINLLPRVVSARRRENAERLAVGVTVVAVAGGLLYAWSSEGSRLTHEKRLLTADQARVTSLQASIGRLNYVNVTDNAFAKQEGVVRFALTDDVDWTEVLTQVAQALPAGVWLANFNGQAPSGNSPGTVSVNAHGEGHPSAAAWITDESHASSLTDIYVASSTKPATSQTSSFTSTADLSPAAISDRLAYFTSGANN